MKNRSAFWLTTIILSILLIYTLVTAVVLPVFTKNALPEAVDVIPDQKEEISEPIPDSLSVGNKNEALKKLFELEKAEKLLQSRLALANGDSMYLVLDLINEKAILEMKGVALHECKIIDFDVSNSIKMYHNESLINWFAEPFRMEKAEATIPKIIFAEKIAPKDTAEANKVEIITEAPKQGDVFIVMDFERNLQLVINQAEKPDKAGRKSISALRWKYKKKQLINTFNSMVHFNTEASKPQIEIVIPKTDAIIIYRALPVKPKMVLKM